MRPRGACRWPEIPGDTGHASSGQDEGTLHCIETALEPSTVGSGP